jgi:endonuclease YncB( thermonuclease family)
MKLRGQCLMFAVVAVFAGTALFAQDSSSSDSGLNLALHANSHATAADIGLPEYPGAKLYKDPNNKDNDSSADIGLTFGDFHFRVQAVSYVTGDSPEQVLAFYRKPLSHYGEVLECDHGKPVGKLTTTDTGLTCSDEHGGHVQVNGSANSSDDHELRVGTPHKYRIVGIDEPKAGQTKFGLVYLELPKDKNKQAE